ncbi:DUF4933 domain-containing protein [Marinifilum flexuosum]|uniref:DUF4933 domain-containing protein n=1 Tax=Marinifilum flexuosum TaxID=1117708 RepID=UPI0024943E80|nr:DUF4933 domain-containing protein [Marinifilum flexuosum]
MRYFFLIIIPLMILSSCKNKSLKLNENDLAQKILSEEEILAQKEELRLKKEQELADSLARLPKGFRFESVRKTDASHPPIVIDIENRMDSIKEFKLSDVAKGIEYIKMQNLPDSGFVNNINYKYYMTDKHIVASNLYGIHLFTKNGEFKNTIVKNQLSGVKYKEDQNQVLVYYSEYANIGGSTSVWSRGDQLYYNYRNTNTGQNYIMEVDCSKDLINTQYQFDPENPLAVSGAGKVLVDLNRGQNKPFKAPYPNGMSSFSPQNTYEYIGIFTPDRNTYFSRRSRKGNMLEIFNTKGDTLAEFTKFERLVNFKARVIRGFDYGTQYEKGGNYYFRSDYNDTIFKVIPPNIIKPEYVIKLGKHKVSKQDASHPNFDLKGKIVPNQWADGNNYIFIGLIMDDNYCPNSRKRKSIKLLYALYSKKNKQLHFVKSDPYNYNSPILQNDIDGGFSVWPSSYMINREGHIMVSLLGKDIKEKVASDEFKNSTAPAANKEKLVQLAKNCSDTDQILMLVK